MRFYLLMLLAFIFASVKSTELPDEAKENSVVVLFKEITLGKWNTDNKTTLFKVAMSNIFNGVCSQNPNKCSLNFWNVTRKFLKANVVIAQGFPQRQENDLAVEFFMLLPVENDIRKDGRTVIPQETLREAVYARRENISTFVGATVKSVERSNIESDDKNFIDNKMNYIMIPISFAVLFVLCIVACCFHLAQRRRQKIIFMERRKHFKLRKHISPEPVVSNSEVRPGAQTSSTSAHFTTREQPIKKKRKKHLDENKHKKTKDERFDDHDGQDFTKGKKKIKHKKENRSFEEYSESGGIAQSKACSPVYDHGNHHTTDEVDARKPKKKKRRKEKKDQDDGYAEGSESRQTGVSEDSLITSLPHPRQLPPLGPKNQNIEV